MCLCDKLFLIITICIICGVNCLPTIKNATLNSWPPKMKNYDIWGMSAKSQTKKAIDYSFSDDQNDITFLRNDFNKSNSRNGKVLNFFPVPVDDECLSDDGRRSGVCLNVYECRIQGGTSKGQCALGFGVCCVFIATCDQEVFNNITYIVSPSFPAHMASDYKSCKIKIKMISPDISQLRLDFVHFTIGQPNRRTGICDGDIFSLTGGSGGAFTLCGQNHGQHMYYDVPGSMGREEPSDIELVMNFTDRFSIARLWEIRMAQIPFSQRAPAGCLQYFAGTEGIIQTFNFAENGRHLANQHYRACVRQDTGMCSIAYEPCTDQSFRIGPNYQPGMYNPMAGMTPFGEGPMPGGLPDNLQDIPSSEANQPLADAPGGAADPADPAENGDLDTAQTSDDEVVEGSGGGEAVAVPAAAPSSSFFSLPSFFRRGIFGFGTSRRQSRQFYSQCTDRITMPCIVEDFIAAGMGNVPDCSPIHCGNTLCAAGVLPCRIESTVTPFGVGINFGDGMYKGSPEENIGACLRFNQISCA